MRVLRLLYRVAYNHGRSKGFEEGHKAATRFYEYDPKKHKPIYPPKVKAKSTRYKSARVKVC
jgi:hypothetical protein